jgi:hypothetical protein
MKTMWAGLAGLVLCAICTQATGFQGQPCPNTGTEFVPEKTHDSGPKDVSCQSAYPVKNWSCHRFVTVIPDRNKCAAGGQAPGFRCVKDGIRRHVKYRGICGPRPEECTYTEANPSEDNVGSSPNFKPEACDD